jgi:hypothetical protein
MFRFSIYAKLEIFVASVVGWTIVFLFIDKSIESAGLKRRELDDIKNRVVSILHGMFCVVSSGLSMLVDESEYGETNTPFQEVIILISAGYFFYDMIVLAYYNLTDEYLLLHHSLSLLAYATCFVYGNNATEAFRGLFLAEISNFPMHLRSLFKIVNLRYTLAYELCECAYFVIYIIARGFFLPQLMFHILNRHATALGLLAPMFCAFAQAMIYIVEMIKALSRKHQHYNERTRKGIRLEWFKEGPELRRLSYYRKENHTIF